MPTNVFNSLDSKSIFPIVYFLRDLNKSLFKIYKPWIKPTSYMVKHNITNFDLKQNVFENRTKTQVQDCEWGKELQSREALMNKYNKLFI